MGSVLGLATLGAVAAVPAAEAGAAPVTAHPNARPVRAASTATATLAKASYVNSFTPTTPSASSDILRTNNDPGNNRVKRTYLSFTVSGVPQGATGVVASLGLTASATVAGDTVVAHTANAGSWTAANLTWNNQPGYASAALSTATPTAGARSTWNVTGALPASVDGTVDLALDEPSSSAAGDITFNGPTAAPIPSLSVSYTCGLSSLLVPTCAKQALFGMAADDPASTAVGQFTAAESRYGRTAPIWHTFHSATAAVPLTPGDNTGNTEIAHAKAGQIPLVNWKPSGDWSTATGGDATVNARIKNAADNIKAVGTHKIMLSIYHEPENDVAAGAPSGCPVKGTVAGDTPANYRAMWANVRKIFDGERVTNVVWTMITIPSSNWDCLRNVMWPGNSLVDWIGFDSYQDKNGNYAPTWNDTVGRIYSWYNANSASAHNYASKPYGIMEFGATDAGNPTDQAWVYQDYADAKTALDAGTYPNIRAYVVFDVYNTGDVDPVNYRTSQTATGTADPTEQQKFDLLANDPLLFPTINN